MKHYQEQMPLYLAGQMNPIEASELEQHLAGCPLCQEELSFWRAVSGEVIASNATIAAPAGLAEQALERIQAAEPSPANSFGAARLKTTFFNTFSLLRAQAYLIQRDMWPTSAAVMALAVIVALISNHVEAITFIAPLAAAASLAMLYGPANDPAYELAMATSTSTWKILLARLSVVSAYNLLLASLASLAMLLIVPPSLLGMITLGWLAPMAFLSALALLLSVWIGTTNAVTLSYGLWVFQFIQISKIFQNWGGASYWGAFLNTYRSFWQSPSLLLILSLVLLGVALFSTRYAEDGLAHPPI